MDYSPVGNPLNDSSVISDGLTATHSESKMKSSHKKEERRDTISQIDQSLKTLKSEKNPDTSSINAMLDKKLKSTFEQFGSNNQNEDHTEMDVLLKKPADSKSPEKGYAERMQEMKDAVLLQPKESNDDAGDENEETIDQVMQDL